MSFSVSSDYIILSSNSGTIHIFKTPDKSILHDSLFEEYLNKSLHRELKDYSKSWIGELLKPFATLFISQEKYEDLIETIKSNMSIKDREFSTYNMCAMNNDDTMVNNSYYRYILYLLMENLCISS